MILFASCAAISLLSGLIYGIMEQTKSPKCMNKAKPTEECHLHYQILFSQLSIFIGISAVLVVIYLLFSVSNKDLFNKYPTIMSIGSIVQIIIIIMASIFMVQDKGLDLTPEGADACQCEQIPGVPNITPVLNPGTLTIPLYIGLTATLAIGLLLIGSLFVASQSSLSSSSNKELSDKSERVAQALVGQSSE